MTSQITTTFKDSSVQVKLPRNFGRDWKKAKISVRLSPDSIVIQKAPQISQKTFEEMLDASRRAAKAAGITRADVEKAIRWARRTKNKAQ